MYMHDNYKHQLNLFTEIVSYCLQTLILGNRDDIEDMSNSSSVVLTTVLKLIDRYDLYGQVAYPKHHKQSQVPEIYRLAAKTKVCILLRISCFCNHKTVNIDLLWQLKLEGSFHQPSSCGTIWSYSH